VTGNCGWAWAIDGKGKQKRAAGKLLEFMLSTDNAAEPSTAIGGVPGVKSAAPTVDLCKPGGPLTLCTDQFAKVGVARPPHPANLLFQRLFIDSVMGSDVKG
jgi:multiple sugar transport system substrate-binding protein